MKVPHCSRCGKSCGGHDLICYTTDAGPEDLCTQCFNADVAQRLGMDDFDNHSIDPISIADASGKAHTFHFSARLMGPEMVVLEAFELVDGMQDGYRFQMIAEPGEERFVQLGRLVQKIRRALATQYLADGAHGLQIRDMTVQGHIEADMREDTDFFGLRVPMLMVDGREVSWEEFGRMLMTFEGFQFKLQLFDPSDDLDG